jgi:hypothetical protein
MSMVTALTAPATSRAERVGRALAALLSLVLVTHWRLWTMLVGRGPDLLFGMVALLFALLVVSIAGLARRRAWGYYAVYALVPVATVLHGVSLVPLVPKLFPVAGRFLAIGAINVTVLAAALYAQMLSRQRAG